MLKIYRTLSKRFGSQGWWPMKNGFSQPEWEVEVGAVLTQNAAWNNVEKALENLKKEGITTRKRILEIPEKRLAELIRPSGYFNQKARKLKILANYSGKPKREELLSLWGIGPETADSILLYAHGISTFVVDAYTRRIFTRMGILSGRETYNKVKEKFESSIPRDVELYKEFHALIVRLAKEHCKTKPVCSGCPLSDRCLTGNENNNII